MKARLAIGYWASLIGNSLGLKSKIVIPTTQVKKKQMLRICGAELIEVDALPYSNPGNYIRVSERISKETSIQMVFYGPTSLIIFQIKKLTI